MFLDEWDKIAERRNTANRRVDFEIDEWGRQTPIFREAMDDINAFTFPLPLLLEAARLYMQSGEIEILSPEEVMYRPNDWETQVVIVAQNLKWAKQTRGN
jgi:hypothetical protein